MKCPTCNKQLFLESECYNNEKLCSKCIAYLYRQYLLSTMFFSNMKIENDEEYYFSNIHYNFYDNFLNKFNGSAKEGAKIVIDYYINAFNTLATRYSKEELQFMAMSLREISVFEILDENIWIATHTRSISHIFTSLLDMIDDHMFEKSIILDNEDVVTLLIVCEEVSKIISNVRLTEVFDWDINLKEMLKTRVENTRLEWFHNLYEFKDLYKPEEIEFSNNHKIRDYLDKKNLNIEKIEKDIAREIELRYGFSFEDISLFVSSITEVAKNNEQIFEISPKVDNFVMQCFFIFKDQLCEIGLSDNKINKILNIFTYKAQNSSLMNLSNPHMDYKFITEFEDIYAFGLFDSSNSQIIFRNLTITDHFGEDIFGEKVTAPFKKAQQRISTLMAYKIAAHFQIKQDYFVPVIESQIPYVNVKMVRGNGIRKKIMNDKNQDLGDLDVVVVNNFSKKIIVFEIKYYKPSVELHELVLKDKKIFEDITKIQRRATWIQENISEIIKAWGLEKANYEVETIIVTARPNFYGNQLEKMYKDIKYQTFDGVLRM